MSAIEGLLAKVDKLEQLMNLIASKMDLLPGPPPNPLLSLPLFTLHPLILAPSLLRPLYKFALPRSSPSARLSQSIDDVSCSIPHSP